MHMVYVDGRPIGEPTPCPVEAGELADEAREKSPWSHVEVRGAPGRPRKAIALGRAYGMGEVKVAQISGSYPTP